MTLAHFPGSFVLARMLSSYVPSNNPLINTIIGYSLAEMVSPMALSPITFKEDAASQIPVICK
jgi:hypothetical protein